MHLNQSCTARRFSRVLGVLDRSSTVRSRFGVPGVMAMVDSESDMAPALEI